MSIGPDDPRKVGGRYWSGYWGHEYDVLAVHQELPAWRGRLITIRWQEPCAVHPAPCAHSYTVTHATAWETSRDRIVRDPGD